MRTSTAYVFEDTWSGRTARPPVPTPRPARPPRLIQYDDGTSGVGGGGGQPGTGGAVEGITPGITPGTTPPPPLDGAAKPCGCD